MTDFTAADRNRETAAFAISEGSVGDYMQLMKPRVMSLVVFTALVGLVVAPGYLHPVLGVAALLANCIPPDHVDGIVSYLRDFTDMPLGVYPRRSSNSLVCSRSVRSVRPGWTTRTMSSTWHMHTDWRLPRGVTRRWRSWVTPGWTLRRPCIVSRR